MKFRLFCLIVILLVGCKKSDATSSKKEATTDQPTEVSGGFGLTMQCSVMNREVSGATASEIGCIVSNNDGSKFTGDMKDLKAAITASGRTSAITASPEIVSGSGTINVALKVEGLKPSDAQSIELAGKFDDKPAILAATLKGRFALICDDDVTYYVNKGSPDSNLACTEQAPCDKISQAIALLPDIFNCSVTIKVAGSDNSSSEKIYKEQLKITGRQVTDRGALKIIGVSVVSGVFSDVAPTILPIIRPNEDLEAQPAPVTSEKINRVGVTLRAFGTETANVQLENLVIDGNDISTISNASAPSDYSIKGKFEQGISAETAFVILKNMKFKNFSEVAIRARNSSRIHIEGSSIETSLAGIEAIDSFALSFRGSTSIFGPDTEGADTSKPIFIGNEDSYGIRATGSKLVTYANTSLSITGVRTGISMNQSSTDFATLSQFLITNTHTGLALRQGAEWNWIPDLLAAADEFQPKLVLDICYFTCISTTSSTFSMGTVGPSIEGTDPALFYQNKTRPRLTLNSVALQSTKTSFPDKVKEEFANPLYRNRGLIEASGTSIIKLSFLENLWCIKPNTTSHPEPQNGGLDLTQTKAVYLSDETWFVFKMTQIDQQSGCETSGTMRSVRYVDLGYTYTPEANPAEYQEFKPIIWDKNDFYFSIPNPTSFFQFFESALIWPYTYWSSTAGNDPLEIIVANFKSVASVKVGGVTANILSFDPNYEPGKQRLIIKPPAHSPTVQLPSDQQVPLEVTGTSTSLAEPGLVSRKYRIEYGNACPQNYLEVASDSNLGTDRFCVMKYEAKLLGTQAVSQANGLPQVNISRNDAKAKCEAISPYHKLISNAQWQALARNIESNDALWDDWDEDGTNDALARGHSDNAPATPLSATEENLPCFATGDGQADGSCDNRVETQWRYLKTIQDERIWDLSGNVAEWVSDDYAISGVQTNKYISTITGTGMKAQFGPLGVYTSLPTTSCDGIYKDDGTGKECGGGLGYLTVNTSAGTYGIARGGSYSDGTQAGIFAANATLNPNSGYPHVGFRCVVVPPETVP